MPREELLQRYPSFPVDPSQKSTFIVELRISNTTNPLENLIIVSAKGEIRAPLTRNRVIMLFAAKQIITRPQVGPYHQS